VRDRIMQITIRGHHLAITPAIEENIKSKFNQFDKRSHKGSSNHVAEAIVRLPGIELFAQATADDMYTSIKKLTEKLKRQLLRYRKMQCTYSQVTVSV